MLIPYPKFVSSHVVGIFFFFNFGFLFNLGHFDHACSGLLYMKWTISCEASSSFCLNKVFFLKRGNLLFPCPLLYINKISQSIELIKSSLDISLLLSKALRVLLSFRLVVVCLDGVFIYNHFFNYCHNFFLFFYPSDGFRGLFGSQEACPK